MTDQNTNDISYIKAAAELRLRFESWKIDQKFKSQGGKIFYAVDIDIIKMFSDPSGTTKYSSVFPGDDEQTCEILTWALGQFVFFHLDKSRTLLIIPPHNTELESILVGIASSASQEREDWRAILPKIDRYLKQYQPNDNNDNMDDLISMFKKDSLDLLLFAFGGGKGSTAELSRMTELLMKGRILNIERYTEPLNEGQWAFPIPPYDDNIEKSVKEWSEKFRKTKRSDQPHHLFLDDAIVMARLEWMNEEMAGDKVRLVLITGASALQRAAKDYLVDDDGHTFADLYIRDPRVFMASTNLLRINNRQTEMNTELTEKNDDLIGWLDVFLARYHIDTNDYVKSLREILSEDGEKLLQEFVGKTPDCIVNLKRDWKECVKLTAIKYSFSSEEDQFKNFLEVLKEKGLTQIKEKVEFNASKVWIDFWKIATITGLESTEVFEEIMDPQHELPLRGVPALRLPVSPFNDIAKDLCCTLCHQDVLNKKDLFDNMLNIDKSGYCAFLVHALAFGAKGRWNVSSILSRYALNITQKSREFKISIGNKIITGNEACYLLAWAIRHTVKTVKKLSDARQYMKEAKKNKAIAEGSEFDFRYESEFIAINITYHLFRIFAKETIPNEVPRLSQCQSKIIKLLENPEICNDKKFISIAVQKQLLAYLFCALLLRQCKDEEPGIEQESKEIAQRWLPEFDRILNSNDYRAVTCFTEPVYLAAKCYYKVSLQGQYCQNITDNMNKGNKKYCYVMPYDEAFYGFLLEIKEGKTKSPY